MVTYSVTLSAKSKMRSCKQLILKPLTVKGPGVRIPLSPLSCIDNR
jgi:hypothetical protein